MTLSSSCLQKITSTEQREQLLLRTPVSNIRPLLSTAFLTPALKAQNGKLPHRSLLRHVTAFWNVNGNACSYSMLPHFKPIEISLPASLHFIL